MKRENLHRRENIEGNTHKRKSRSKRKKHGRVFKGLVIAGSILLVLGIGVFGAFTYLFGDLNSVEFTDDDEELGITEENSDDSITNIVLFGVDTRDMTGDTGRSDTIIILSVDQDNNIIKMTSILRDSKVSIDGHGENKINAAYAYGGPTLAIKTINQNFNMDIKEYVTVNFDQLASIVDAVGGVTITLTQTEINTANAMLASWGDTQISSSGGEVLLTGPQALAYSRIRKIDSDDARASRQQNVITAIFEQIKTMSKSDYPSFIRQFLGIVETSLSYGEILKLSPIALTDFSIEQNTIPDADYETDLWGGIDSDGVWYYIYDIDAAADRLHSIIYDE